MPSVRPEKTEVPLPDPPVKERVVAPVSATWETTHPV